MADENFSFIPKKTFTPTSIYRGRSFGIFGSISFLIFLIAMVACGGLYFYRNSLTQERDNLIAQILEEQKALEPETINELVRASDQIKTLKNKIKEHKSASPIFKLLTDNTLTDVAYSSFKYDLGDDGIPKISLSGVAKSYGVLASQVEVFEQNAQIKKTVFANIGTGEKGLIKFDTNLELDPSVVNFVKK